MGRNSSAPHAGLDCTAVRLLAIALHDRSEHRPDDESGNECEHDREGEQSATPFAATLPIPVIAVVALLGQLDALVVDLLAARPTGAIVASALGTRAAARGDFGTALRTLERRHRAPR